MTIGRNLKIPIFVGVAAALALGGYVSRNTALMRGIWASEDGGLSGDVRSSQDGPLEGVVVIAKADDSAILTAVTTDASGHYSFPPAYLHPGRYQISIRAAGYRLGATDAPQTVTISANAHAEADLALVTVTDVSERASQLTTLDWIRSFPGSDAQKDVVVRNMVNCGFCHSVERIARSAHSSDEFVSVIQRMATYESDHSSADRIQIASMPAPLADLHWWGRSARAIADYFASVNLSNGKTVWSYPLTTMPRPSGRETRAIVTVFPIPRAQSVVHDLDVDAQGNVWYGNTGWDYIGKLNPRTGRFQEWPAPNFLPKAAGGMDRIVGVQDIQVDGHGHVWAAVGGNRLAKFDPKSARWWIIDMPVIWKNPFISPSRPGEKAIWFTGITALPEGDRRHEHAFRLDLETMALSPGINLFDDRLAPVDPNHRNPLNYCYMMEQDRDGNFLCPTPEASAITRVDRKTGKVRMIPTPTPNAYPRRGYRDPQNRFWFSEFYADKIGVIDLNTDKITEYQMPTKYISPYFARPDRFGTVWASSTGSDRLLRLDPATGKVLQYLLPVAYDARKIVIDDHAPRPTIWIPNKNRGELIRVEALD